MRNLSPQQIEFIVGTVNDKYLSKLYLPEAQVIAANDAGNLAIEAVQGGSDSNVVLTAYVNILRIIDERTADQVADDIADIEEADL